MSLFYNRKPRSFHHEYIYVDERKEFIEKLKAKYKQNKTDLDKENPNETISSHYRKAMQERVKEEFRSNNRRRKRGGFLYAIPIGLMALLLIVLFIAMCFCFS